METLGQKEGTRCLKRKALADARWFRKEKRLRITPGLFQTLVLELYLLGIF